MTARKRARTNPSSEVTQHTPSPAPAQPIPVSPRPLPVYRKALAYWDHQVKAQFPQPVYEYLHQMMATCLAVAQTEYEDGLKEKS